jgi:hypothetical protein
MGFTDITRKEQASTVSSAVGQRTIIREEIFDT